MGDVNINEALEGVRSGKLKERTEGLADLKDILSQNRRSPKMSEKISMFWCEVLTDKGYHKIFEALFRLATSEKSVYVKASKSTTRNQSASRLSSCAAVVRLAVEVGVRKLRPKTVKALVDHITQTLPTVNEGYCEPLCLDYLKSLRTVLEYQPHVEHMPKEEWHDLTDFCNEGIALTQGTAGNDSSNSHSAQFVLSGTGGSSVQLPASTGSRRDNGAQDSANGQTKTNVEELVFCLCQLTSPPNAPILEKAQSIMTTLMNLLQSSANAARSHQAAFSTMNRVLTTITTNDISLTREFVEAIVPLIRRFWPTKSMPLKDEMLITLTLLRAYITTVLGSKDAESFRAELEGLLQSMQSEYSKRAERDQLQLDELRFLSRSGAQHKPVPLSIAGLHLRMGMTKSEQTWAIPQTLGFLLSAVGIYAAAKTKHDTTDDVEDSRRKRRRMVQPLDDLLRQTKNSHLTGRLCALQIIPFLLDQMNATNDELNRVLDYLLSCISDENGTIASWAMIGIASCVYQPQAQSVDVSAHWVQIWRIAVRSIPSPNTCRAACHLLGVILVQRLVEYAAIADLVEGIVTSVEHNGPALLVDSSLSLWALIVEYRQKENPSAAQMTSERVLQWLFSRWSPARFLDRTYAAQVSHSAQPPELLDLLYICTGRSYFLRQSHLISWLGPISQTSLSCSKNHALIQYLLLTGESAFPESTVQVQQEPWWACRVARLGMHYHATDLLILNFCIAEISLLRRNWSSLLSERTQLVTVDMMRTVTSACIVGFAILSCPDLRDSHRVGDLRQQVEGLRDAIGGFLSRQDCEQDVVDALLETFSYCLPPLSTQRERKPSAHRFASQMAPAIAQALERRRRSDPTGGSQNDIEAFDIDDSLVSQGSHARADPLQVEMPRDEIGAETNLTTFRQSLSAQIQFLALEAETEEAALSSLLVEYITSLRATEVLACRSILRPILSTQRLARADVSRILEYLGHEVLQSYEFERCEISMLVCLDVLTTLAELWTVATEDDLADKGAALYEWFIIIALGKGISSSGVQIGIANMLQQLLIISPDYAKTLSLPSVRTSYFFVLHEGNISVKFYLAEKIPRVFSLFILKEHDAILEDIVSSLPSDRDWTEGIALRLVVLARLAASWPTLLRRSVYHMFETPGHIPECSPYAKRCLLNISLSLSLPSPRALFKLFVSQLLYTWMESQPLRTIPHIIFGYPTLADMFRDVQDEIVGQVAMRMDEEQEEGLSEVLGAPFNDLLAASFDRAMAYSLGRDISVPPSQNTKTSGAESHIRTRFSKEVYLELVSSNFVQIVANLFKCMDQEEQVEKAFGRHKHAQSSLRLLHEIRSISASDNVLPANQQPSFRAKYIMDELEYLCRRTSFEVDLLWTPALFVFVFRKLLDTIHPALGSLHACSVIRRIRILVCVAGPTALQDYPLEMALHALRPFLTDGQCAEDALGIFQYLLQRGKQYLKQTPSFLAGIALSTLASLRAFLNAAQESTTQESQHRATMSKAQKFHSWFSTYLISYDSPGISGPSERAFKAIVLSASNIRGEGNALVGSHESTLLRELLEDQQSDRNLLNRASQDLVFRLLCKDFTKPGNFRDDIFGEDEVAATHAMAVWRTCQRDVCGEGYLLWAARVLGRAYASTGSIGREMLLEAPLETTHTYTRGKSGSKSAILGVLCEELFRDERKQVGLAENCIQSILARIGDTEESFDYSEVLPHSLMKALVWAPYSVPVEKTISPDLVGLEESVSRSTDATADRWIRNLTISLSTTASEDAILSALPPILFEFERLAKQVFPYILHIVLLKEHDGHQRSRRTISNACQQWFRECDEMTISHVKLLISAVLYLRNQPLPHENTSAERTLWLDLDYGECARAAAYCGMYKTALLFVEIYSSQMGRSSRRSSNVKIVEPTDILLSIFRNIDEPDSFYGVQQQSSLSSVMDRLDYENAGFKSLSFRGAHFDSQLRQHNSASVSHTHAQGLIKSLADLSLHGISHFLLSNQRAIGSGQGTIEAMLQSARKLEQWDIPAPSIDKSEASTVFRALQCLNNYTDLESMITNLDSGFLDMIKQLIGGRQTASALHSTLRTLAVLTEIDEVIVSNGSDQLEEAWHKLQSRETWMLTGSYADVNLILSSRETLLSALSYRPQLQTIVNTGAREIGKFHVLALLDSTRISRSHGDLQNSLTTATYLSDILGSTQTLGIRVEAAVEYEAARVLWDQGEMSASIKMLQLLDSSVDLRKQTIHVGKPELLARLGHQIAEARLEKPDEIINHYLLRAIKELKGQTDGNEAAQVFHEFASFCDQQLQNSENLEDFQRIQTLRHRKEAEVHELEKMLKSPGTEAKQRDILKGHRAKAKQWFELDDREFRRLRDSRQAFLRQSLENYLLCLKACDTYNSDVMRFCTLWLEQSQSEIANTAVSKHITKVPSRKFAPLMNQLSSRLLDIPDDFQNLLFALVLRICVDHPYHGMYHIFAASKTKGGRDQMALARHSAAVKIVNQLKGNKRAGPTWIAIHNANISYVRFAAEKLDETKFKPKSKGLLRKLSTGQRLEQDVTNQKIPPPTMKISLRADCDYSNVPLLVAFLPEFTVASGISVPKIITAVASDGLKYKQLYKSGNDDLRQDSIMEQVFEQVSNLLQSHRETRQRNLGIRTYKVLPLTASQGIIEFVQNTIPLHEYLMPAHQKHFPKDMKPNVCRQHIADAQNKTVEVRVKVFRQVCEHFHPVMRYFFMERFDNPDDWFERRLAYSRSTAAISILGYVLGLGDRHGHNILLDEKTGEVVHIDLGIAFEQGRVLPVPEVVPFRLTRDLVDGMGITKTEGVFRRCCEFTLDALRKESYSIMTILDVLRYDPLYSWSVSPLRLKRMQEAQDNAADDAPAHTTDDPAAAETSKKKENNEPGEADRALTVVAKKLSKSLSVTATVNELIQQATDERNLAVLFAGWAAYA